MKLYNCEVRLGGSLLQTVPRQRVSEKELDLLRRIHGADALANVTPVGEVEIVERDELLRLARAYNKQKVEECFQVRLDEFDAWLMETIENEEAMREDRRGAVAMAAAAAETAKSAAKQSPAAAETTVRPVKAAGATVME